MAETAISASEKERENPHPWSQNLKSIGLLNYREVLADEMND